MLNQNLVWLSADDGGELGSSLARGDAGSNNLRTRHRRGRAATTSVDFPLCCPLLDVSTAGIDGSEGGSDLSLLTGKLVVYDHCNMQIGNDDKSDGVLPLQLRAARALLGWTWTDLSAASGLTVRTIAAVELADGRHNWRTIAAIRSAIEMAGVEFAQGAEGEPLVRSRKNWLVTGDQVREARRLLGMSGTRLNALAGLPAGTIEGFERTGRVRGPITIDPAADRFAAIRGALESVGVEFIDQSGVRLKLKSNSK